MGGSSLKLDTSEHFPFIPIVNLSRTTKKMDYAHISHYPNREESAARTAHRLQNEHIQDSLQDGFPVQLESKMVWDKGELLA